MKETAAQEAIAPEATEACFRHKTHISLHEEEAEEACDEEVYDDEASWPEEIKQMKARSAAWAAQARRKLEESGQAAAYDAWELRMVQKAQASAQFISHEEMVAKMEAWCQATLREMEAQGRRMEDEDEGEDIYAFDDEAFEEEAEAEMGSRSGSGLQRNLRLY